MIPVTPDAKSPPEPAEAEPSEAETTTTPPRAAPEREVVIRIRRRGATPPWRLTRVLAWATTALFGDPLLLLAPPFMFIGLMLVTFGLGAPGRPEVLLPLVSLPPIDAFQDVVIVDLGSRGALATWLLRLLMLTVRTVAFGTLLHLVVQRARGRAPALGEAVAFVRRRFSTLAFLELVSFAAFGVTLSLSADLTSTRDDGAIGTALLFGVLLLVGMFVAAGVDESPAGSAGKSGFRRLVRRPLGHLGLVLLYGAGTNGLYRLASIGETGWPRALPLILYSFVSVLLTTWFLLAFTRRQMMLDADVPAEQAARKRSR